MTEFEARALVQQLIVNGLGEHPADFHVEKLMENLFMFNAKRWDIERIDTFLLLEVIMDHRK